MGTPVKKVFIIFRTSDGYINTAPPKDERKTFHKLRVYVV